MTPEEATDQILGGIFPMTIKVAGKVQGAFQSDSRMRAKALEVVTAAVAAETQRCLEVAKNYITGAESQIKITVAPQSVSFWEGQHAASRMIADDLVAPIGFERGIRKTTA